MYERTKALDVRVWLVGSGRLFDIMYEIIYYNDID